ncbi:hypothetical protein ElyMa_003473400 [Elysia marginata]|uniref:G-protein coupled receptors family 1 profile domain-containing protein n=1 Tax=Elysia marginata TaxID=1093978 RepID=A0AAV4EBR1_9GAST|nr:hypothetical protein ElyMa_003473400 [Elysia marginata]
MFLYGLYSQVTSDHGVFFVVGWTLVIMNVLHMLDTVKRRRHAYQHSNPISQVSPPSSSQGLQLPLQPGPPTLSVSAAYSPPGVSTGQSSIGPETSTVARNATPQTNIEIPTALPRSPACSSYFLPWMKIFLLTALPWVVSTCTVVPLVLSNASVSRVYRLEGDHLMEDVMCMLRLPRAVLLIATFLSLYLPFYICAAALVVLIFCHGRPGRSEHHNYCRSRQHSYQGIEDDTNEERREISQSNGLSNDVVEGSLPGEVEDSILQPRLPSQTSHLDMQQPIPSSSSPLIETMQQRPVTMSNLSTGEATVPSERRILQTLNNSSLSSSGSQSLFALCLPNAVYLMCYTPLLVHTWLHLSRVYTPDRAYGLVLFVLLSRSFLLPLTWLAFPDIRQETSELWIILKDFLSSFGLCGLRGRASMSSSSSVSFSRLQENQTMT